MSLVLTLPATVATAATMPSFGLRSMSDAHIQALEKLHREAEDRIIRNDFRSAIRIYGDIILEEPDDETAYTGLGQCYLVLGDFRRAKDAYLNALHINPDNQTAHLGLEKIQDPDSMNFTEKYTANIPAEDAIELGAKKAMAPYSVDIPQRFKNLSRNQLIQAALKNAGFYRGPVDGIIGPVTRNAIRDFQKKYDLAIDGKVGPRTWELLQPYIHQNSFDEKVS